MDDLLIREVEPEDLEAIAQIEEECFSVPLKPEQLRKQLAQENHHLFAAVDASGTVLGYAGMYTVLDEGYIINVAVATAWRRHHLADRLLDALEQRAWESRLAFLTLEVRESNAPAAALYEKHGFTRRGLRKDYYQKPKENALILTQDLK